MADYLRTRVGLFTVLMVWAAALVISSADGLNLAHPGKVWLGLCQLMGFPMFTHWLLNLGRDSRHG